MVVWGTLLQTLVPGELLGRVTSLDWFVSTSLVPISFALTGPVSHALGAETTLVVAGLVAALATIAFLFVPGRAGHGAERQPARLRKSISNSYVWD